MHSVKKKSTIHGLEKLFHLHDITYYVTDSTTHAVFTKVEPRYYHMVFFLTFSDVFYEQAPF